MTEKFALTEEFRPNLAQRVLLMMGMAPNLLFAHHKEPNRSFTKKGLGRVSAHKK